MEDPLALLGKRRVWACCPALRRSRDSPKAGEIGTAGALAKPFEIDDLVAVVERVAA